LHTFGSSTAGRDQKYPSIPTLGTFGFLRAPAPGYPSMLPESLEPFVKLCAGYFASFRDCLVPASHPGGNAPHTSQAGRAAGLGRGWAGRSSRSNRSRGSGRSGRDRRSLSPSLSSYGRTRRYRRGFDRTASSFAQIRGRAIGPCRPTAQEHSRLAWITVASASRSLGSARFQVVCQVIQTANRDGREPQKTPNLS
jgi:hypothetical protein